MLAVGIIFAVTNTLDPVTLTTLEVPATLIVTLPFAVAIFTLLFPLLILLEPPPDWATQFKLPEPFVLST